MKTEKNILIAFILNLIFSLFEFLGGVFTGSVAIVSDAVHDLGDAASIGVSYFLEKKSKRKPDDTHTFGYARYSVLGGLFTTVILITGSLFVIYNAIKRIINPIAINYDGMIVFAVVGVVVNLFAAFVTKDGDTVNMKAVNLHMLEDVLGWIAVLVGAVVMRFTSFSLIDPIISICVSLFILIHALKNLKEAIDLFLEKIPNGISVSEIERLICEVDGVKGIHHVHIRSFDGENCYASLHVVTDDDSTTVKKAVREVLKSSGILHATIETETSVEAEHDDKCNPETDLPHRHHHHH